jgi:ferrochelatase
MEAGHEFKENGGEEFLAIPCLNDGDDWCATVGNWIKWSNVSAPLRLTLKNNSVNDCYR